MSDAAHAQVEDQLQAHNDDRERPLCALRGSPSDSDVEAMLVGLRHQGAATEPGKNLLQELALILRPYVVTQALQVSRRYPRVPVADLVNEGMVRVLELLPTYEPGRAEGRCLVFGWVAKVSKQAMAKYARDATLPVKLTKHGRSLIADARRVAGAESVAETLADRPELAQLATSGWKPVDLDAEDAPQLADDVPSAEDQLISAQLLHLLASAIDELPDLQRRIVALSFGVDGQERNAYDVQIAKRLGIKAADVQALRAEALATLRNQLGGD